MLPPIPLIFQIPNKEIGRNKWGILKLSLTAFKSKWGPSRVNVLFLCSTLILITSETHFLPNFFFFFRLSRGVLSPALKYCSPAIKQGCNSIANKNPRGIREQPEYSVQLKMWGQFLLCTCTGSIQTRIQARLKSFSYRGCQDSSNDTGLWFTAHLEGRVSFSTRMFEFVVK